MQITALGCYRRGSRSTRTYLVGSHTTGNEKKTERTLIVVPSLPAQGFGSAEVPGFAGVSFPSA